jgi:hypothetical protein
MATDGRILAKTQVPDMKMLLSIFLILAALAPTRSMAQGTESIYQRTLEQCGPVRNQSVFLKYLWFQIVFPSDNTIELNSAKEMFLAQAFSPQAIMELIDNRGLSTELKERLDSPEFNQALDVCFPNEPLMRELFVLREISSDVRGKIEATAGTIATTLIGIKGASALKNISPLAYRIAVGGFATWSVYKAVAILQAYKQEASTEQQAKAQKVIDAAMNQPEKIISETKKILTDEITRMDKIAGDPQSSPARREHAITRMNKLKKNLRALS